jgi:hypothetical protein
VEDELDPVAGLQPKGDPVIAAVAQARSVPLDPLGDGRVRGEDRRTQLVDLALP